MNVPIKNLLVNRSSLTRGLGIAGIPLYHLPTHVPVFENYFSNPKFSERFGKLSYNFIQEISKSGGGYSEYKDFEHLINTVSKGIKNPLTGWNLSNKIELKDGHHRAAIAFALGIKSIPIKLWSLDSLIYLDDDKIKAIREVYNKVSKTENLKQGYSYNSFPGLRSIRKSLDRIELIYTDIITCRGNKLVDLGCNDGYFGINLLRHDFDVSFVDRSEAYLNVVKAKLHSLNRESKIFCENINTHIFRKEFKADVVIYLDVFYHVVLEERLSTAYKYLNRILQVTNERLIFAPGRWDKLEKLGCTQKDIFDILVKNSHQIRYLGHDSDKGYKREIYSIYK